MKLSVSIPDPLFLEIRRLYPYTRISHVVTMGLALLAAQEAQAQREALIRQGEALNGVSFV